MCIPLLAVLIRIVKFTKQSIWLVMTWIIMALQYDYVTISKGKWGTCLVAVDERGGTAVGAPVPPQLLLLQGLGLGPFFTEILGPAWNWISFVSGA